MALTKTPQEVFRGSPASDTYRPSNRDAQILAEEMMGEYSQVAAAFVNADFEPEFFGAVGDGVTDDSAALQSCINQAATEGRSRVRFGSKTYYCASDLYLCYDATNNMGFPSGSLLSGRAIYSGSVVMSRRDYANDTYKGSVIKLAAGKKVIASVAGTTRGWKKTVENMSFVGSNATIFDDPYAGGHSIMRNLFYGTDTVSADTPMVRIKDYYLSEFSQIEGVHKDLEASNNRIGWGIQFEPSGTAGGANVISGIDFGHFDKAVVFGRPYDAAKVSQPNFSKGTTVATIQGAYANVGIHIMHGIAGLTILASWAEHCDDAPYRVDNSAENITITNAAPIMTTGEIGSRGLIVVGNDTGTAGVDAAYNVTVNNGVLFCSAGVAGVFVHNAAQDVFIEKNGFSNAGGAAIGVPATGIGGEVTARDNQYGTGMGGTAEIDKTRRFCSIAGTFGATTYTPQGHRALDVDWKQDTYAGDIDASTWRRPPKFVSFNTLSASRTLTLPLLSAAGGRLATVKANKAFAANTVTIDAQTGATIKGAQTYVISSAYKSIDIMHAGAGTNRWDVVQETV